VIAVNAAMISFSMATVILCRLPILLPIEYLGLLAPLAVFGLLIGNAKFVYGFVLGVLWITFVATNQLQNKLPKQLQGREIVVQGSVASVPKRRERGVNFNFAVDSGIPVKHINVTWYDQLGEPPRAAEFWSLNVKLHRPRGQVNPALFDYEAWLLSRRIDARGYVVDSVENFRLKDCCQTDPQQAIRIFSNKQWRHWHHHLRARIRDVVIHRLQDTAARGLIVGLLIGESNEIGSDAWQALSHTGTNHLLIISGLHVGLVFGFLYWLLARIIWSKRAFVKALIVSTAVLLTFFYGALAGFGLPVQRSLMMILVGATITLMPRSVSVWSFFCVALTAVLLVDPFASLSAGFWLSFGAVGSLILGLSGRTLVADTINSKVRSYFSSQWIVFVTITPILLCWVMQASVVSMLVNLIAIPFVAFILVPGLLLCLPIVLLEVEPLYGLLDFMYSLAGLFYETLTFIAGYSLVLAKPFTQPHLLFIALFGALLLLLPKNFLPRWPGIVLLVVSLDYRPTEKTSDLTVRIVDVGQGLSVVFRTPNATVIYDAGPKYSNSFDAGKQIVAPTAKILGARHVDRLVVSHSDIDHAGGVDGLLESIPTHNVILGSINSMRGCEAGTKWQLDQTRFETFSAGYGYSQPGDLTKNVPHSSEHKFAKPVIALSRNDASCVMLVRHGAFSMLLPGDIEKRGEQWLLTKVLPSIDVMIAPHHGSLSSSSPQFLNHLSPDLVIVSAGHQNRFGHPHPLVMARYRNRGMSVLNTASSGAITLQVDGDGRYVIEEARKNQQRFWYD
jgi:competence protein ComEC